ncbi:CDP-glycerol glycerophosphotransferase family protein [Paraclostridium sordellii]|uniref:CDP-glycerol glycerophosphotransferase family protein n=1 Tax=Paraclostridium sordellii TaxID=1505 RepID=UPI0005DD3820|nr:CDP-glycerol glycerophosphotransferase family protein [Paeniclostridium sordellii]CEN97010.1 CDP-glycerol:poly(glycerophosphate) glycerophosphotransferase [[Clostridium] sordellii] [Paeniclostridium sordellii]CEN97790.1 CDP-glycerol:poly(glycerophosphate) glycerophosphotransferase [[Clostridium] sordellii] [Paeniclostridium sordellii]
MEIINKIEELIKKNDIENAYKCIIENEKQYLNNAEYWNLRGILCSQIKEYEAAISCYKTSIDIKCNYIDAYFNLIYTYMITGEKLKSVLNASISLRYIDDINYINDINNLYQYEESSKNYTKVLNEAKTNVYMEKDNASLITYIAGHFNHVRKEDIQNLYENNTSYNWAYIKDECVVTKKEIVSIDNFLSNYNHLDFDIIVPYDINYINVVRNIASKGVNKCFVLLSYEEKLKLIEIDNETMIGLRNEDYKRTVTLNRFNAADSNVYALIKYIPKQYKDKYKLNVIKGTDVYDIENIVKVPIISPVTISGFNTFCNVYPKFTYNIEVGHGEVGFKGCGLMDKKSKEFSFTPEEYKKIDKIFTPSKMCMLLTSAFTATPEDKYEITGNPRTDLVMLSDGKRNLEKLLGISLENKKVIFNMPTFYVHENSGIENGSTELNDAIKIKDFDYEKFNQFLIDNNIICISKVHHGEERSITNKVKNRSLDNIIFISNDDLESKDLDLYEVLNAADILITDYSSIYGDFLFMDKPTIFVNTDMDIYEKERGIILQPYDFWAAGPKVQEQDSLSEEIIKCISDKEYYKKERNTIRDIFYYHKDDKSSARVWDSIDCLLSNL